MKSASARSSSRTGGIRRGEVISGWLFTAPMLLIVGLFLVVPIGMALWVSVSDYSGRGSPFSGEFHFVGLTHYAEITSGGGLTERNFGIALRNSLWYTLLVVPTQTAISLMLAVLLNRQRLRGRGFFRTAFYFPSVTSSVAITVLWLFLFNATGAINAMLGWLHINGPNWFNNPQGLLHATLSGLGVNRAPNALARHTILGVSWWDWLAGPSWAMTALMLMAIFTTSGTFMLLFIAALQNLSPEVDEAAIVDGANGWQRFWQVTLPQVRPTIFTVVTLGVIGCWQVFDQVFTGTQGQPANTTLTPAYLAYNTAFGPNAQWGTAAAIGFVLFVIIILFNLGQRAMLTDRSDRAPRPHRVKVGTKGAAS
ncbi:MAG: sugar ABC transporter permease [Actinomycetia bacterium]|nr:sugar ABC transporter permease [Actinomycetes bacterium]